MEHGLEEPRFVPIPDTLEARLFFQRKMKMNESREYWSSLRLFDEPESEVWQFTKSISESEVLYMQTSVGTFKGMLLAIERAIDKSGEDAINNPPESEQSRNDWIIQWKRLMQGEVPYPFKHPIKEDGWECTNGHELRLNTVTKNKLFYKMCRPCKQYYWSEDMTGENKT